MKKVVMIHTGFVSVNHLNDLFRELVPEATVENIVDDSLLHEIMQNGEPTPGVIARICGYAQNAQSIGADLIFNQCSSAGPAYDVARRLVGVPILKVDEAMAEEAARLGGRIAVIATIGTTVKPSCDLVKQAAERLGTRVDVVPVMVTGAYEALFLEKDTEKHNQLVRREIERQAQNANCIVLAQGSMVSLMDSLPKLPAPVLTSPRLGVLAARKALNL